ncbi:hypothetical protein [uncultured Bacteroides sp.]|uniref:hypothetical protein n=1 Tax=uncultured Bacteroides sp. TaxID=162156 RepID=UPI002AA7FE7F|nr:hypothetical protein [uncultured Bacteroides sp.]
MVKGLERFRDYFRDYSRNYVIIGGTACNQLLDAADVRPRATKDIDVILIVEALTDDFVKRFWEFVKAGQYELWQTAVGATRFYRFIKPADKEFPAQIELFSRVPDMITLPADAHLSPIPVGEELSSFSAILLDDIYYKYATEHGIILNDLNFLDRDALVLLKVKAYLNNIKRREQGEEVRSEDIYKHKKDIYRIVVTFQTGERFDITEELKIDLREFIARSRKEVLDTKNLSRELGVGELSNEEFLNILEDLFML